MPQWLEMAVNLALRSATGMHGWTLPALCGRGAHPGITTDALRLGAGLAIGMAIAVALALARETTARRR